MGSAVGSTRYCFGVLYVGKRSPLRSAWSGRYARPRASRLHATNDGEALVSVAEIMQGIKSASSHKINRLLGRRGQVWQRESFDHVLRREESIHAKVAYIIQNPVRAGLADGVGEYR